MNTIKIDKRRDILIAEKVDGTTILKDGEIYCGCCGSSIGTMKKKLKFPFNNFQFLKSLKNKSVNNTIIGLYHKTCGHTMFAWIEPFQFISLENQQKEISKLT